MLSQQQIQTLQAAVNRIIPPDDYPGGWDAGVGDYLLRQFQRDLSHLIDTYRAGLDALDAEAQTRLNAHFHHLTAQQQDSLLTQVEQGQVVANWPLDPAAFLIMLAEHCAEGFYSDPGNGGNHNTISWQMIGFEVRE